MSEIKVNKISPRTACGTTTLGDSGDTFTIPAGVTITNNGTANGFGATGAVNWQTTVKTHSPSSFTAVAGEGYFINTTGGAVTVNLPAGTAGAVVGIKDYAGTFDTNAVTLNLNGSDKAGGSAVNPIISTEGIAITLVFIDSTQGWLVTDSGLQSEAPGPQYITASGGTPSTVGDFKIHTFTGPGTFTVSAAGNAAGNNKVEYLVIAGGGGGGGGGRTADSNAKAGGSGGGGGSGSPFPGAPSGVGGAGNTPSVTPPQGQNGGAGPGAANNSGGGGGGAGAVGGNWSPSCNGGTGGAGVTSNITNTPTQRAGGGGGSGANTQGSGGAGGGGSGGKAPSSTAAVAGTVNTGGGGGGGQSIPNDTPSGPGAQGGSGLVVLRYKFQN